MPLTKQETRVYVTVLYINIYYYLLIYYIEIYVYICIYIIAYLQATSCIHVSINVSDHISFHHMYICVCVRVRLMHTSIN